MAYNLVNEKLGFSTSKPVESEIDKIVNHVTAKARNHEIDHPIFVFFKFRDFVIDFLKVYSHVNSFAENFSVTTGPLADHFSAPFSDLPKCCSRISPIVN